MTTFTVTQAAALLQISPDSIYRRLPEFRAVRIGRTYRIPATGIEAFCAANTVRPALRQIRRAVPVSRSERLRRAREIRSVAMGAIR